MKPRGEQDHVFLSCCYASSPHLALSLSLSLSLSLLLENPFLKSGHKMGAFRFQGRGMLSKAGAKCSLPLL